jgi:hypothetical protein
MSGIAEELIKRQMKPKVVDGQLERPYPIQTRGDVNRARVLPPPVEPSAVSPEEQGIALEILKRLQQQMPQQMQQQMPMSPTEQPQGGFDYVAKRNALLNGR